MKAAATRKHIQSTRHLALNTDRYQSHLGTLNGVNTFSYLIPEDIVPRLVSTTERYAVDEHILPGVYSVFKEGKIYDMRKKQMLAFTKTKGNYNVVSLETNKNRSVKVYFSHLMLLLFVERPLSGSHVSHFDRDHGNDRLTNLFWYKFLHGGRSCHQIKCTNNINTPDLYFASKQAVYSYYNIPKSRFEVLVSKEKKGHRTRSSNGSTCDFIF
jgi:hypothetical protein